MCVLQTVQLHTILRGKIYFTSLTLKEANVNTMLGTINLIEDSERANIMLSRGANFHISNALYSSKFRRKLLNFKDIPRNGYHIEITNESNIK